jgi:hypothetical protein
MSRNAQYNTPYSNSVWEIGGRRDDDYDFQGRYYPSCECNGFVLLCFGWWCWIIIFGGTILQPATTTSWETAKWVQQTTQKLWAMLLSLMGIVIFVICSKVTKLGTFVI